MRLSEHHQEYQAHLREAYSQCGARQQPHWQWANFTSSTGESNAKDSASATSNVLPSPPKINMHEVIIRRRRDLVTRYAPYMNMAKQIATLEVIHAEELAASHAHWVLIDKRLKEERATWKDDSMPWRYSLIEQDARLHYAISKACEAIKLDLDETIKLIGQFASDTGSSSVEDMKAEMAGDELAKTLAADRKALRFFPPEMFNDSLEVLTKIEETIDKLIDEHLDNRSTDDQHMRENVRDEASALNCFRNNLPCANEKEQERSEKDFDEIVNSIRKLKLNGVSQVSEVVAPALYPLQNQLHQQQRHMRRNERGIWLRQKQEKDNLWRTRRPSGKPSGDDDDAPLYYSEP